MRPVAIGVYFVLVICGIKEFPRLVPPFDALWVPALRIQVDVADTRFLATPVAVALVCRERIVADVLRETVSVLRWRAGQLSVGA